MGDGGFADEGESELKVRDARPDGKDGGEDGWVNGREGNPLEHDPAEGYHLSDGADFARPVRLDFDASLVVVENPEAAHDNDVAGDDEDNEPDRESPSFGAPWKDREGGEGEEEEALVGERIEEGSEFGELVELARKITIEGVGDSSNHKDGNGGPAKGFDTRAVLNTEAIVNGDRYEERDTQEAKDGDVGRNVHR